MKVIFDKLAQLELKDATEFYELEVAGLGKRFQMEVKQGIRRICEYPLVWTKERGDIRKYILHKFPYKILYSIEEGYIYIIAIAHGHRRPNYWVDRISDDSQQTSPI
jgi:plasmid stabilization system protein ParE